MAKGDDARLRKKNKANRKKLNKESSTVSARVAAIIAAKKRRMSGKRRMCEGMCFSLPTPDNPFNDRHEKKEFIKKETKKPVPYRVDGMVSVDGKSVTPGKENIGGKLGKVDLQVHKKQKIKIMENGQEKTLISVGKKNSIDREKAKIQLHCKGGVVHDQEGQTCENSECPSKFLIMCLNSIQNALRHDGTFSNEEDKPLLVNAWGVEFWKCYSVGKDLLETSGACSTVEQIAWMVSTAADSIARKEKEGGTFTIPFLLFLVRSVCKPLKALGIHTVSLHPGASLDHQIHGLKSCEPEFLVSTPERLLELISLKAVDISGVSLLVVDGLEAVSKVGHLDMIKSIRQSIFGNPITVVFNDCLSYPSVQLTQSLISQILRTGELANLLVLYSFHKYYITVYIA
ncbi:hypothetical protein L1049_011210 [Liquidambar formosana]|uniref:DEAD/DEAH box helicase domain-containing protein n=1 Tax=Liquidambar formosana TaxID=63359 RepID=A0AAP0X1Y1_LIQFO